MIVYECLFVCREFEKCCAVMQRGDGSKERNGMVRVNDKAEVVETAIEVEGVFLRIMTNHDLQVTS